MISEDTMPYRRIDALQKDTNFLVWMWQVSTDISVETQVGWVDEHLRVAVECPRRRLSVLLAKKYFFF